MSPKERCPSCGKKRMFHVDELEDLKEGDVICTKCALERSYYEFFAEVLDGKHPELIKKLKKQLEEEQDEAL